MSPADAGTPTTSSSGTPDTRLRDGQRSRDRDAR
jgi:hypothetical protein